MRSIRRQDAQRLFCDCLALDKIQAFLGWPPVLLVDAQNVLHLIANIIEDAYIENVGCSCYDCMELYLKFGQAADLFAMHPGRKREEKVPVGQLMQMLETFAQEKELTVELVTSAARIVSLRGSELGSAVHRGIGVIAVSLDAPGAFDCYDSLSEIYPNLIACNDLRQLAGQLLRVIAKLLV